MSSDDTWGREFSSAEPMAVYDEVFVPRLFAPLAEMLLDDVGVDPGARLLDVACGPGTVALAAARRGARVTGCDISPAMLDIARRKSDSIEWVETGAAPLVGIADAAYDMVTCQQGLQFFPDRPAAVAEMHRALAPGGRVGIAIWAALDRQPAFAALRSITADLLGEEAAARYEAGPWALTDPHVVAGLLREAGFADTRVGERSLDVVFEGGGDQVAGALLLSPVGDDVAQFDPDALESATRLHLAPLADDDGAVRSPVHAFVVVAHKP